jgi:uncharacterized membrane protein YgcG
MNVEREEESTGVGNVTAAPTSSSSSSSSTQSTGYEVARILKLPENRLCADCSAPLFGVMNTFASLEFGVWICAACAEMHKEELSALAASSPWILPKPAHSTWSVQELQRMQSLQLKNVSKTPTSKVSVGGNVSMNKILERYIPNKVWQKITPTSGTGLRRTWIRAKYYSHYFSIPHYDLEQDSRFLANPEFGNNQSVHSIATLTSSLLKDERKTRIDAQKVLPTRLIDYFLILGPTKLQPVLQSNTVGDDNSTLAWTDIPFTVDSLDCYPKECYADTPIPELIAPMVFPDGARLSTVEKQPFSFTYVLTDINRIKLYGASLIIYELVDPQQLRTWIQQYLDKYGQKNHSPTIGALQQLLQTTTTQVLYVPKALTVLSHYPFHSLFQTYLARLYHISLSSSPLPLERYVINLVHEVPLPPQGKVEVMVSLPGCLLSISRPPINQLPMVDFSYRPLFATLSIDHILQIFTCLALERSVCICASNVALLTPIQEALLSFLFPFVWQGCYVPILPTHLLELLDAPVPLLVGMHDEYLRLTPPELRPSGVLFVHVDTDTVSFGARDLDYLGGDEGEYASDPYGSELGNKVPALPKAQATKLRAKLVELAGHLYKQCDWLLKQAGNPFPHQEHYTPLDPTWFQEQGLVLAHPQSFLGGGGGSGGGVGGSGGGGGSGLSGGGAGGGHGGHWMAKNTQLGIRTGSSTGQTNNHHHNALPFRHPAACTVVTPTSERDRDLLAQQQANRIVTNLLDAQNNALPGDVFHARDIREAFLRFWVASLGEYNDYFAHSQEDGTVILPGSRSGDRRKTLFGSSTTAPLSTKILTPSDGSSATSTSTVLRVGMDGVDGGDAGDDVFLTNLFAQHLQNSFLNAMIRGQMFSIFRNEKLDARKAILAQQMAPPTAGTAAPSVKSTLTVSSRPSFVLPGASGGNNTGGNAANGNGNSEELQALIQPEIRFFDEHIQAKRNRSKLTLTKASTPFLSDESCFLRELYTVPAPSVNGLDPHATYSYTAFPNKLDMDAPENKGYLVRKPRLLVDKPELKRWQDDSQAVAFLKQTLLTLQQQQRQQSTSTKDPRGANNALTSRNLQALNNSHNTEMNNNNNNNQSNTSPGNVGEIDGDATGTNTNDPIVFFRNRRLKYMRTIEGIIRMQAYVRRRPLYRAFHRQHRAVVTMVRFYRAKRIWRSLWKRHVRRECLLLQRQVRRWQCQRRYRVQRGLILWLQATLRQRRQRRRYLAQRGVWIRVQARWRGWNTRRTQTRRLSSLLQQYRRQVVYLWMLEHTSLRYRALFWKQIDQPSYVHIALYQEELTRLYQALHCAEFMADFPTAQSVSKLGKSTRKASTTTSVPSTDGGSGMKGVQVSPPAVFTRQFEAVQTRFPPLQDLLTLMQAPRASVAVEDDNAYIKQLIPKVQDITRKYFIQQRPGLQAKFSALMAQEDFDRQRLYQHLKTNEDKFNVTALFQKLHIEQRHRRKRKLAHYVWMCVGEEIDSDISADIVLTILPASASTMSTTTTSTSASASASGAASHLWLEQKLAQRVQRHCVETVHACLISLQRVKQQPPPLRQPHPYPQSQPHPQSQPQLSKS